MGQHDAWILQPTKSHQGVISLRHAWFLFGCKTASNFLADEASVQMLDTVNLNSSGLFILNLQKEKIVKLKEVGAIQGFELSENHCTYTPHWWRQWRFLCPSPWRWIPSPGCSWEPCTCTAPCLPVARAQSSTSLRPAPTHRPSSSGIRARPDSLPLDTWSRCAHPHSPWFASEGRSWVDL